MEVQAFQRLDPETYYRKFISNDIRPDGRSFNEVRELTINTGVLSDHNVYSSSLVRLGPTKVVAGVTLQIGHPEEATPSFGALDVQVHLTPLCSSKFTGGRKPEQAQALEALIQDILISSRAVDLSELCIETGSHAWQLCLDVVCLSYDGNVTDAALLAATACLAHLKLPLTENVDGKIYMKRGEWRDFPMKLLPVPLTCGVFDGVVVTDPSGVEEELVAAQVTVVQTAKGQVCGLAKPGGTVMPRAQLASCVQLSLDHSRKIESLIRAGGCSPAETPTI